VEVMHERCAALDISKRDVKACVRTPDGQRGGRRRGEVRTFASTTNALLALLDWLRSERVTLVAMEATGDYWRPVFYLLEQELNVILVNARDAKAVPGRKTDVTDAAWLCQLAECGLLRASFVPPEPIRRLRDLTRMRTVLTEERSRTVQRLEKELEDAGIRLSCVATDILGVSGRAMLEALIDGERDPEVLAAMARARMRSRLPDLMEALTGNFSDHHAFVCRMHLDHYDHLGRQIDQLTARIEAETAPFQAQLTRLETVPGISRRVAEVVVAETGADMTRFPTAGHLASWAGVCPGNNESGGRRKPGATRHGNRWLNGALGISAMAASRTKDATYLGALYRRLAGKRGKKRALVALEHSILVSVWHMLTRDMDHRDLGGDYFLQLDPDRATRQAVRRLHQLGYQVTLDPSTAAA
jgi:transposase